MFVQEPDIEFDNLSISLMSGKTTLLLKELFMKITSTGFGCGQTKNIEFDTIMFVHYKRTNNYTFEDSKTVIKKVSIHDSHFKIAQFFKEVSDLMKTKVMRDSLWSETEHYQFVLSSKEYEFFPVKWFTLWLDNGDKIDHDIAFSVTYITKNGIDIPFGRVNFSNWEKFPKYRELNMKKNAFKYIANQIMKFDR